MVKVSVGVTVYNVEEYLRECLDSIMNQTFKDFEVIMVDDGSTDNSFNICQEYVARDNRFKLIHQENKGNGGARNTCVKHMHGDYIVWIDSDDRVKLNYLERLLEIQKETNAQIVNSMFFRIERGIEYYLDYTPIYPELKTIEISNLDALKSVLFDKYLIIELCGALIDSNLYKGWFCSQGVRFEDLGSKFKLYTRANKVALSPEQLYGYRQREDGTMGSTNQKKNYMKELEIMKDVLANLERYIYYMEIMNADIEDFYSVAIDFVSTNSMYRVNKINNEEDKQKFLNYVDKYKEKLKRYWNI